MTTQPPNISVTLPVSQAIDRVKRVLFQPFDLGKWFAIGFCAWLAYLGERGFGSNFNFGQKFGNDGGGIRHEFERAKDYVMDNLHWILPLAAVVLLVLFALGILFTWLNSRGKFMFLHCVALNKAEVVAPWDKFAREANSLFWFRFVLGLIGSVLSLPLAAVIVVMVLRMVQRGAASVSGIMSAGGVLLVLIAVAVVFALIRKLTMDFVVPIMFLRGKKCLECWSELRGLISANVGSFVVYILFQIVLAIVIGAMVIIAILLTCCIAGCLMALPYLGTVLLLPVLVFNRSYSLYYLAQFGPEYDVFPSPAPPAPGLVPLAA
jgi:hypothetical protein